MCKEIVQISHLWPVLWSVVAFKKTVFVALRRAGGSLGKEGVAG